MKAGMKSSLHPFLEHPGVIPFAHRGFSALRPENTMAAFEAAVELDYRYIETDVLATADGQLIAFHDDELEHLTDQHGRISELTWAEVKKARVEGQEPIPLFAELLTTWPDLRINIEPKDDASVTLLFDLLEREQAWHRVNVGCFSGARLNRMRLEAGPKLCSSMGPFDVFRMRAASYHLPVGHFDANCVQVPTHRFGLRIIDKSFLAAAKKRGLPVHVWTINEEAEMARLIDLGVDAIMTDRAIVLKELMQRRGMWPY